MSIIPAGKKIIGVIGGVVFCSLVFSAAFVLHKMLRPWDLAIIGLALGGVLVYAALRR